MKEGGNMTIAKGVKGYLKNQPWPDVGWRMGPLTCDDKCKTYHAYAQCVEEWQYVGPKIKHGPYTAIIYDRPCWELQHQP